MVNIKWTMAKYYQLLVTLLTGKIEVKFKTVTTSPTKSEINLETVKIKGLLP